MARMKKGKGVELTRRLAVYSAAVGAGLAVSEKVEAAVVASGPLSQNFGFTYGAYNLTMEGVTAELNFNGGYISNFTTWFSAAAAGNSALIHAPGPMFVNQAPGSQAGSWYMIPMLANSAMVGPATNTPAATTGDFYDSTYSTVAVGDWNVNGEIGYMGFSFMTEGTGSQRVYGWAEIQRLDASNGRLLGWAYEDSGAPIHVPEPSALALMALGAAGVGALRRRRT